MSELEARFGERNAALASSLECLWPESETFLRMSKLAAITDLIDIKESSLTVSECEVARELLAKEFDPTSHKDLSDMCRILFPLRAAFPNVYIASTQPPSHLVLAQLPAKRRSLRLHVF